MKSASASSQTWLKFVLHANVKAAIAPSLTLLTFALTSTNWIVAAFAQSASPRVINSVVYRCDDSKGFSAEYLDDKTVRATFGSKVFVLPQEPSASGARYSNGSVTIFTKGNDAFVEVGDKRLFDNCIAVGSVPGLW
ncbi:MAG: MliC family protein [Oscillatoriales cyanobacterium C42_A2020_001]|nr:MliC family protein [Leptolyngbyaceae cyanobacterium C42_A2020_001]